MSPSPRYVFFLMVQATEQWLGVPRDERRRLSAEHIGLALARRPGLALRHFDAEAFTATCSDVMMVEASDPVAYYDFMEMVRDSPMFTAPYFRIVNIIPAIEDGFREFEMRAS